MPGSLAPARSSCCRCSSDSASTRHLAFARAKRYASLLLPTSVRHAVTDFLNKHSSFLSRKCLRVRVCVCRCVCVSSLLSSSLLSSSLLSSSLLSSSLLSSSLLSSSLLSSSLFFLLSSCANLVLKNCQTLSKNCTTYFLAPLLSTNHRARQGIRTSHENHAMLRNPFL